MSERADHLVRGARVAVGAAAVLAVTLVAAACGGGSGGGTTATTAATTAPPATTAAPATTTAAPNGAAGHSASRILADARTAAGSAQSVHVAGTVPAGGQTTTVDLKLVAGKGGSGTLSVGGTSVDLIQIGKAVYLRGGKALFQKTGAPSGVAQLLAGKWFRAPTTGSEASSFASLSKLMDMRQLLDSLLTPTGTVTKAGTGSVAGTPTVVLKSSEGSLDVSARGPAYPLSVRQNAGTGRVTFTEWNAPVTLTAPPGALDFSTVTGG